MPSKTKLSPHTTQPHSKTESPRLLAAIAEGKITEAFQKYRQDVSHCNAKGEVADATYQLESTLESLDSILKERSVLGGLTALQAKECLAEYIKKCDNLKISRSQSLEEFITAATEYMEVNGLRAAGETVFVEEPIARKLLGHSVPSGRYGGLGKVARTQCRNISMQCRETLERKFRDAMAAQLVDQSPGSPQILRHALTCEAGEARGTLCGTAGGIEALFAANAPQRSGSTDHPDHADVPYPIFICSKGRPTNGLLNWRAQHCLAEAPVESHGWRLCEPCWRAYPWWRHECA